MNDIELIPDSKERVEKRLKILENDIIALIGDQDAVTGYVDEIYEKEEKSCFISLTQKDVDFTKRLLDALVKPIKER